MDVIEFRKSSSFKLKLADSFFSLIGICEGIMHLFYSYIHLKIRIACKIDESHPATADKLINFISSVMKLFSLIEWRSHKSHFLSKRIDY